jgi:mannose-6-phosphate isomerase
MLYPLTFAPIFKERVWGGRKLQTLFGKKLPAKTVIGESWEVSDRPGDVSVVSNGPLAGKDLHWLVTNHRAELFGPADQHYDRFPLLIKILDAQEKLSLQVHPPAHRASEFGGEPKTEMWYIAAAEEDAELFVGLKHGVTQQQFEDELRRGTVEKCFHRVPVRAGDAMFLPSGRVHAIGSGLVIFEIQQNSDSTYRVFDWNRLGLDGQPRPLHISESLVSIDFNDFEPSLIRAKPVSKGPAQTRLLVDDPLFRVEAVDLVGAWPLQPAKMQILGVISGRVSIESADSPVALAAGGFCLVPAEAKVTVKTIGAAALLCASLNHSKRP